jgi:hypothetical protein
MEGLKVVLWLRGNGTMVLGFGGFMVAVAALLRLPPSCGGEEQRK